MDLGDIESMGRQMETGTGRDEGFAGEGQGSGITSEANRRRRQSRNNQTREVRRRVSLDDALQSTVLGTIETDTRINALTALAQHGTEEMRSNALQSLLSIAYGGQSETPNVVRTNSQESSTVRSSSSHASTVRSNPSQLSSTPTQNEF